MSRGMLIRGCAGLLTLCLLSAAPADNSDHRADAQPGATAAERELAQTKAELARERAQNLELSKALADAKFQINDLKNKLAGVRGTPLLRYVPVQPVPPQGQEPMPNGWQMRRFNGMNYYLVPLGPDSAAPATQSDR